MTQSLTPIRPDWCIDPANWKCCCEANTVSRQVRKEQKKRYGSDPDNGRINAIKHCAWQCALASLGACGGAGAKAIGDRHETGDTGASKEQHDMDFHNNHQGRALAPAGGLDSCYTMCERAAKAGMLHWNNKDKPPKKK